MCVFFFQAEDGIRDGTVTGVQTCALPICPRRSSRAANQVTATIDSARIENTSGRAAASSASEGITASISKWKTRSEERRVGKECRSRGSRYHEKKKRWRTRSAGSLDAEGT